MDLDIPRSFWSRLAGKYGNMFYWKEKVGLVICPNIFIDEVYTNKIALSNREKMRPLKLL